MTIKNNRQHHAKNVDDVALKEQLASLSKNRLVDLFSEVLAMKVGVPANDDRFYTVREAATRWKVHPETVRRQVRAGLIRVVLLGDNIPRIPVEEIHRVDQRGFCTTGTGHDREVMSAGD